MSRIKVIIMGAAGRDFHNFKTVFRDNDAYEVVAFTATQIPNIDDRRYPPELAGKDWPGGWGRVFVTRHPVLPFNSDTSFAV